MAEFNEADSFDSSDSLGEDDILSITPNSVVARVIVDEETKKRAEALKEEGNQFLSHHKFHLAAEKYSEAIDLYPSAIYYSNRAQSFIKLESYGSAIQDAKRAIELDPNYMKGYYRLASANFALGNFKEAKKDFMAVLKIHPNDSDAKKKMLACSKAIKEASFREAIAMEEEKPIDISILDGVTVEKSYDGPILENENGELALTPELVIEVMKFFKKEGRLPKKYLMEILFESRKYLDSLPTLLDISLPQTANNSKGEMIVCGDTHGQFYDLCNIFELGGYPSKENPFLFNGDFVDRGSFSVEVITTLLAWMLVCPQGLHLLRGNHEARSMNRIYGFFGEVNFKYDTKVSDLFSEVFDRLPLAAVIEKKIFVVHGGISSENDGRVSLETINRIPRRQEPSGGLMSELLWTDPHSGTGKIPSCRGMGVNFGSDITENFLNFNNLSLVVRSHQAKDLGYEVEHNGKCITIFSAPNYCDQMDNKGAFIRFGADLQPRFVQFDAVPHPNIPPMKYSNASMFGI